jgi:DNA-binding GntR family transcriptional regulator
MPRDESPEGDPYNLSMRTTAHWQTGSMVDEIAEILRERIVEGRLASQEPLTQRRVAEDLNVSRAVAGEALRMLHREGLLDSTAGTMRVAATDGASLLSAYTVREVIDGAAAGLAARHAGPGTHRRCQKATMLLTQAQLRGSIEEHEAILIAVSRGEPEPAERAARAHVRATIDALAQLLPTHDRGRQARSP